MFFFVKKELLSHESDIALGVVILFMWGPTHRSPNYVLQLSVSLFSVYP